MRPKLTIWLLGGCAALVGSCIAVIGDHDSQAHDGDAHSRRGKTASAVIQAKSGSSLTGHATFTAMERGVQVELVITDAPPGWHAVHIHEVGDCSSPDGKSAGGHFNPGSHDHGSPHAAMHHAGDLGNMLVGDDGSGYHAIFMPELEVTSGAFGVVGRAIVVHEGADDLTSQPTGAAGGRIGCGEIR